MMKLVVVLHLPHVSILDKPLIKFAENKRATILGRSIEIVSRQHKLLGPVSIYQSLVRLSIIRPIAQHIDILYYVST